MAVYADEAIRAQKDSRWLRRCSLMGCTDPNSTHDHHMSYGHLTTTACHCHHQSGQPGSLGIHEGGKR